MADLHRRCGGADGDAGRGPADTNFLGLAGRNRFFHTPSDDVASTGPDMLEPVARAFVDAVRKISARGEDAFR